jgi:hypothetical protein
MSDVLTRHFMLSDYAVSTSHPELVEPVPSRYLSVVREHAETIMQPIRDHVARPITILSGYRSPALNKAVGGSPTSQHVVAEAGDFTIYGEGGRKRLHDLFVELVQGEPPIKCGQVIYYPDQNFIHAALPSRRYPEPSCHVHEPAKGMIYHHVRTLADAMNALVFGKPL